MKYSIFNLTNQGVRKSKTTNTEIGEYKWEYGYSNLESFDKVGSSLLLYIYMYSVAKKENDEWLFCVPTKNISDNISISTQQIQRSLKKLEDNNLIEDTGRRINKFKVFKMLGNYNSQKDYAIPAIIAVTKTIPLSLKLFILKLQFLMPASRTSTYTFNHTRELRVITNDYEILENNLALLNERGLINDTNAGREIDLKQVYDHLHKEYIANRLKGHNLI